MFYLSGRKQGSSFDDQGSTDYVEVDRPVAYKEVLTTWAKWVDRNIDPNRTTVFFMGMSPNHITYVVSQPRLLHCLLRLLCQLINQLGAEIKRPANLWRCVALHKIHDR